jgi:hypothetical protein
MIRANTTIRVGGRTYTEGQSVTGLSRLDTAWMSEAGYITEIKETKPKKHADEQKEPAQGRQGAKADDEL